MIPVLYIKYVCRFLSQFVGDENLRVWGGIQ
jgi:hypothetical protein